MAREEVSETERGRCETKVGGRGRQGNGGLIGQGDE